MLTKADRLRDRQLQPLRLAPTRRIQNTDGDTLELRGERPLVAGGQGRPDYIPSTVPEVEKGEPAPFWATASMIGLSVAVWAAAIWAVIHWMWRSA